MKMQSVIVAAGATSFPAFMAERVYMQEFYKDKGLPENLARWQPTVDDLLSDVDTDGPIYLMIDSGAVKAGQAQRRRGLHVDGYWNPEIKAHGYGGHGPVHRPQPSHGGKRHCAGAASWEEADFSEKEGLILASSVSACVGYVGDFVGPIKDGGDCSHIDLSGLQKIKMKSHTIYKGNVTCLHESVPVVQDCERQLIRLNIPGWSV